MRLHDRVIRAGLFNRAQFVLRFSRDERLFYEGLMLLADDSHCLLDDPYEFKLHLFPLDSDVTLDLLTSWRDRLVGAGKLVSYVVQGKRCLYLRNGPEHQSQAQNLERPEVPLPPWVRWCPYPKNPYRGTYEFADPPAPDGLSDPSLRPKRPLAEIKAEVSAGLGLGLNRDREGDTGEPIADRSACADGAALGSPAADAASPPAAAEEPHKDEPEQAPPAPEAGAHASQTPLIPDPLLGALSALRALPRYRAQPDDLAWLATLGRRAPDVDLEHEIAKCRDWYCPKDARPNAKAANWRSRLNNWADRAQESSARVRPPARASPEPRAPYLDDDPEALVAELRRPIRARQERTLGS